MYQKELVKSYRIELSDMVHRINQDDIELFEAFMVRIMESVYVSHVDFACGDKEDGVYVCHNGHVVSVASIELCNDGHIKLNCSYVRGKFRSDLVSLSYGEFIGGCSKETGLEQIEVIISSMLDALDWNPHAWAINVSLLPSGSITFAVPNEFKIQNEELVKYFLANSEELKAQTEKVVADDIVVKSLQKGYWVGCPIDIPLDVRKKHIEWLNSVN